MKKLIKICSVALIAWLLTVGVAQAMEFVAPPELNFPGGWETSFPYQRNIYWDFSTSAAHYEGYDDDVLQSSDFWVTYDDVSWFPSLGAIGIDNSNGTTPASGYAVFHIDNWDREWKLKRVWTEIETTAIYPDQYDPDLWYPTPAGDTVGAMVSAGAPDNDVSIGLFYGICPYNPPWEEIYIYMWANPLEQVFITGVHVATECVPAPGAILLGGIGVSLVGWLRRRRTL